MAILRPSNVIPNNISLDSSEQITIQWQNLGDRQYHYQIKIYNNSTGTLAYDTNKISSNISAHVIPANILVNGILYKYQITVWNSLNEFATSDWIIFKCSSRPIANIINLSSNILSDSYLFQGSYSQDENVLIKSWQFILYDSYNTIVSMSPETFSDIIEYQFIGLKNDTDYQIELQVKSQDNLLGTTGKLPFHVQYDVPPTAINLQAEGVSDKAAIRLSWYVTQIIGEITSGTISYIGGEKIDLRNGAIAFRDRANWNGDFHLKFWLEWTGFEQGDEILRLKSDFGDIWIEWKTYDGANVFHVWKNIGGIIYHGTSEEVLPIVGDTVFISMNYINNLIDLHCEVVN